MACETELLSAYLGKNRDAVVRKLDGLPEARLREPGTASGTNLLGLVQHLTAVEAHWFDRVFRGADITVDMSMRVSSEVSSSQVLDAYRRACAHSDRIIRSAPGPHALAAIADPGEDRRDSLRSILVHMVEETARHAGHTDILREQLDGRTGI